MKMNRYFRIFLTIPNILTLSRMLLLPLFMVGFFFQDKTGLTTSFVVFIVCVITDYLDGYYARAYKQTTKLGQMLDPLADKIVVSIAILFIVGFRLVSIYSIIPSAIILCREFAISGMRDASSVSGKNFKTLFIAKCKTATQMIAILTAIFANIIQSKMVLFISELLLWISSIIAIISGFIYYCRQLRKK